MDTMSNTVVTYNHSTGELEKRDITPEEYELLPKSDIDLLLTSADELPRGLDQENSTPPTEAN